MEKPATLSDCRPRQHGDVRRRLLDAVEKAPGPGESYTEVSIGRLAAAAGVSRVTFYAYFSGKGDLLRARFDEIVEDLHAASDAWWSLGPVVTRSDVRAALGRIIETYRAHQVVMAAINDEAPHVADVGEMVQTMMRQGVDNLCVHIHRGQAEGWIDPDLPARETSAWLMWMGERAHHQLIRHADHTQLERHLDTYADLVYKTLYRR